MRPVRHTLRRLSCEILESRWPLAVETIVEAAAILPAAVDSNNLTAVAVGQDGPLVLDAFAERIGADELPPAKSDPPRELLASKTPRRGSHAPLVDAAIGGEYDPAPPLVAAAPPVAGAPTPTASVLSLDLWPNYNTIGVRLAYTQDPLYIGTSVSASLQVMIGGRWVDAHDFVKDVDRNLLVTKVFGLTEGTSYMMRATFARRDITGAVVEQRTIFGTAITQTTPLSSTAGSQVWVSNDGHDRQPGTYEHPKKTIRAAVEMVQPGGSIILKDGEYSFNTETWDQTIDGKRGAAGQYYTLTAENPGGVRIIGYEEVNGAWTAYGNGIYWINAPQLASVWTDGSTSGPNHIVDTATGRLLYPYRSLTADDAAANVYGLTRHPEAGWHYDFASRRLYVRLDSRTAPANGQIRASHKPSGLAFSNSSHWIVDGIHFEQFGLSSKPAGSNQYSLFPAHAVGIYSSDHIIIRNSTFRYTSLAVHQSAPLSTNILVENNVFDTDGIWEVFYREPFENTLWQRVKNSLIEQIAIDATGLGRGMVVRDNSFDGYADSVNSSSTLADHVGDLDIHQNSSSRHMDDVYEVDSDINGRDGGNVNTAIFNNVSTGGLTFVSASSFHRGPLWVINNYAEDSVAAPIKVGQQNATDTFTNSAGWKLIYHNTFINDAPLANTAGSTVWSGNLGHGNLVAKNNIFWGQTQYVFNESSGLGAHRAPLLFERNAFYTTYAGPLRWGWETASFATDETMDAAAPLLEMTDNISNVNPFPSGIGGGIDIRLRDQGAIIKGITAVNGAGQADVPNIGRLGGWAIRSQGGRVPMAALLRIMLVKSGGRVPLSALATVATTLDV